MNDKVIFMFQYASDVAMINALVKSRFSDGFVKCSHARNAAYLWYAAITKDAAQRSMRTFYEAVVIVLKSFRILYESWRHMSNGFSRTSF